MSDTTQSIVLWNSTDTVLIPLAESTPTAIVEFGKPQLSLRDRKAIVEAFNSESYEMVATYVWTKAAAVLKKQVATLGMEFVGEMLGRPDLDDDSDPATSLADHEAVGLAEDLGMITTTQGLRLKHALELVAHFANLDPNQTDEEGMGKEEAIGILKNCITSILGKPRFEAAIRFAEFRKALGERSLRAEESDVQAILGSPYFFLRTTLSVLLALVKDAKGAALQHAVGNTALLLPLLWTNMRQPEKWQVGQAYAEVNAAGNRIAAAGLGKALLLVNGFDFVPESLRSSTFTQAAARVLSTHFATNNFYNEEEPMRVLANLGTAIPRPAFAKCMEATLSVWLGNRWGNTWAAEKYAQQVFNSLGSEQWEYYLNECLWRDRTVLDKLAEDEKPLVRWVKLVSAEKFSTLVIQDKRIRNFIQACASTKLVVAKGYARDIRSGMTA
jgi:hypothetical protein